METSQHKSDALQASNGALIAFLYIHFIPSEATHHLEISTLIGLNSEVAFIPAYFNIYQIINSVHLSFSYLCQSRGVERQRQAIFFVQTMTFLSGLFLSLVMFCSFDLAASFLSGHPYHRITEPILKRHARDNIVRGESTLSASEKKEGNKVANDNEVVALVHSHHLLDHKPDNMILKGGKYKLRGVACLGRPGVALCIGPQKSIDKFKSKLKSAMPQKKFGTTAIDSSSIPVGELDKIKEFEEATLGEFRSLLASLGHEDQFFSLTGIDPSIASSSSSDLVDDLNGDNKKATKKRKRM